MAYITKAEVKAKSEKLKAINKKYSVKATFSGSNSSTLQLTVQSGSIDFQNLQVFFGCSGQASDDNFYLQVNHYYLDSWFCGTALAYLEEVHALMKEGHYDRSDVQSDYFETSWYNSIHIGQWNKGYVLVK